MGQKLVDLVDIHPSVEGQPLTADSVVARYGAPCGLTIYPVFKCQALHYQNFLVETKLVDARLRLDAPITSPSKKIGVHGSPSFCVKEGTNW